MHARPLRLTAASAVALLAACGGGGRGGDGGMPPAGADMSRPAQESCMSDGKPVALAARYAIRATLKVNTKVPADCAGDSCVLDKDATARLLLLADVTQSGRAATVATRPCRIEIPPVALKGQTMPTQLTASDALVQSVGVVNSSAMLAGDSTCAAFTSLPLAIVLGARLAAPASDPVPIFSASHSPPVKLCGGSAGVRCDAATDTGCVCDQEGDGKAGATVEASGVPAYDDVDRVYLALRAVVTLDGMVFPERPKAAAPGPRLKGAIRDLRLDQSPVGCRRSPGGGAQPYDCDVPTVDAVARLNPRISQSGNAASTFVALPVGAGTTCDQLVATAGTLFAGE